VCKSLLVFRWHYVCLSYVSEIFSVKEWRNLEIECRGHSRSLKMAPFDRSSYDFLLVSRCKYSCMLYHFQVIWRWIIMTLKISLKVIQTGTIRKLGCGFLFTFHSNCGRIFNHLCQQSWESLSNYCWVLEQVFKVSSETCQQFVEDAVKISNIFGFSNFSR